MEQRMNKKLILLCLLIFQGCVFSAENRAEMQQTGEVPEGVRNEAKAVMSIYCDAPILGNLNTVLTNIAQGFYPAWRSSCEVWREQRESE